MARRDHRQPLPTRGKGTASPVHGTRSRRSTDTFDEPTSPGIDHTVLIPAFHSDYGIANRRLAAIVSGDRARFSAYAMVHPTRDAGRVGQLVREAIEVHGFIGIKVHRYDARITREVCEVAARYQLPVLYDVMGEAWSMNLVAAAYPSACFIVPHLGSFADDWRAHLALTDVMVRHPNVYADTFGVRRFDYLVDAVRRAGPRKVLLGSDGPWLHPGLELAKIRALGLSGSDEHAVLGGNWVQLTEVARRGLAPRSPTNAYPHPSRRVSASTSW